MYRSFANEVGEHIYSLWIETFSIGITRAWSWGRLAYYKRWASSAVLLHLLLSLFFVSLGHGLMATLFAKEIHALVIHILIRKLFLLKSVGLLLGK